MFDVVIKGGMLLDGTGAPGRQADVGVIGDQISAIGDLTAAVSADTVHAENHVVCPGFIDLHTHSDLAPLLDWRCASKVRQGITTELVGLCGFSAFPLTSGTSQEETELSRAIFMARDVRPNWSDCGGYLRALEKARLPLNMATLVGNGTIRTATVGYDNRAPTADETRQMRRMIAEAMQQGAFGLSCGLTLYPSSVAQIEELSELCLEVARWNGLFVAHTRTLPGWHFRAVQEALEIAGSSNVALEISHISITNPDFWGQADHLLDMMDAARTSGIDVSFDVYPYAAAGCPLSEFLPDWVQDGGTEAMLSRLSNPVTRQKVVVETEKKWNHWDKVTIAWAGPFGDANWIGTSVADLGQKVQRPPAEMMLDIITQSRDIGLMIVHNRLIGDVEQFVLHPYGMIGSDGIAIAADGPWRDVPVHPRFYGTFPRILAQFVRESKLLSLPEAIRKMTAQPADRLQLERRGRLREGFAADIVILDPSIVRDRSTYEKPHQYAEGIEYVMVNGQWVIMNGVQTQNRPGQVLRRT